LGTCVFGPWARWTNYFQGGELRGHCGGTSERGDLASVAGMRAEHAPAGEIHKARFRVLRRGAGGGVVGVPPARRHIMWQRTPFSRPAGARVDRTALDGRGRLALSTDDVPLTRHASPAARRHACSTPGRHASRSACSVRGRRHHGRDGWRGAGSISPSTLAPSTRARQDAVSSAAPFPTQGPVDQRGPGWGERVIRGQHPRRLHGGGKPRVSAANWWRWVRPALILCSGLASWWEAQRATPAPLPEPRAGVSPRHVHADVRAGSASLCGRPARGETLLLHPRHA